MADGLWQVLKANVLYTSQGQVWGEGIEKWEKWERCPGRVREVGDLEGVPPLQPTHVPGTV